jgi:hypothetical protein
MLVLPTGQILLTDFYDDIEIFTPSKCAAADAPEVDDVPTTVTRGSSHRITGHGFTGASQGAAYPDDSQSAANFPLVRITSEATGHVFYARTHDHSSMAVASHDRVYTDFDVSPRTEPGKAKLGVS